MVIEPPGNLRRTRILEVDNGIFVAIKVFLIEERARSMQQAGIDKLHIGADALAIEARKQSGGTGAIETLIVIKDSNSQVCSFPTWPTAPR